MGFLDSLFGKKKNSPRADAPASPEPSTPDGAEASQGSAVFGSAEEVAAPRPAEHRAVNAADIDVNESLIAAREHLDKGDLPSGLMVYEQLAAAELLDGDALATISGDLGATGHLEALVEFVAPRYDPPVHGFPAGINLLQAYLHLRNDAAAQQLFDLIKTQPHGDIQDVIDGFHTALVQLRQERAGINTQPIQPTKGVDIGLVTISRPLFSYSVEDGEAKLPTKTGKERRIAFMPLALSGSGVPKDGLVPREHPLSDLVLGLPLVLAEAAWFSPLYRPIVAVGVTPEQRLFLSSRIFKGEQARELFQKSDITADYAVAGSVRAEDEGRIGVIELTVWDVKKARLMKTLNTEGTGCVGAACELLLKYIEAPAAGPSPIGYLYPADFAAHAKAQTHALHFFLGEKKVVKPESLEPHEPRLVALSGYATSEPGAPAVAALFAGAVRQADAIGLNVPPGVRAHAQRLS